MKPVIGITADSEDVGESGRPRYFLWEAYAAAVEKAGGVPLVLPYVEGPEEISLLVDRIHGLMLTGGAFDIDPSYYGEDWIVEPGTAKETRTRFEMEITKQALDRDLSILGICGGEQNINVALKGSLFQDISTQNPKALNHEQKQEKTETSHEIRITPGTLLHRIVGEDTLRVNSSHHQSVKYPGEGLKVNALSEDGIIEGIESPRHSFVLGVQWHPEHLFGKEPGCRRIFEAFVREAHSRR